MSLAIIRMEDVKGQQLAVLIWATVLFATYSFLLSVFKTKNPSVRVRSLQRREQRLCEQNVNLGSRHGNDAQNQSHMLLVMAKVALAILPVGSRTSSGWRLRLWLPSVLDVFHPGNLQCECDRCKGENSVCVSKMLT
jgi:hypothetical protein